MPVGVGGAALLGWLGYAHAPTWEQSVVGALAGGTVLLPLLGVYWLIRREQGMGWGDPKLLALLGSYFGFYPGLALILIVAATVGSVVGVALAVVQGKGLRIALPFGPFLAFGALTWLFFGDRLYLGWERWIASLVG